MKKVIVAVSKIAKPKKIAYERKSKLFLVFSMSFITLTLLGRIVNIIPSPSYYNRSSFTRSINRLIDFSGYKPFDLTINIPSPPSTYLSGSAVTTKDILLNRK